MIINRYTKLGGRVESLPEAWSFVMAHIDTVGSAPTVEIRPVWTGDDFETLRFEVSVGGSVEESTAEEGEHG